eukprot:NODE_5298_length_693_cov_52.242236_g4924_i0.p2 GENE.NODE_5298_length_693_cov_52.242236_g4924_i0~~NODE_5298_length_693_cov_52.242236_g4924_i0.p2  ORF type:complete len:145 (-),score=54.16 NODE_5298_length_693_cov_52.242236_g4924_i0:119-553(-)
MSEQDEEDIEVLRPIQVKDAEQYQGLMADPGALVVLYFFAPWCEISKECSGMYEETSQQSEYEKVQFLALNVDLLPDVAKKFELHSVPAFFYMLKGEFIVPGFSGSNAEKFKFFLEKAFNKRNEVMAEYDAQKAAEEAQNEDDE